MKLNFQLNANRKTTKKPILKVSNSGFINTSTSLGTEGITVNRKRKEKNDEEVIQKVLRS